MTLQRVEEEMPAGAGSIKPNPESGKPEAPARPAWLPQKFKEPEALAKSYVDVERKNQELTAELAALKAQKPAPAKPAPKEGEKPTEAEPAPTPASKGVTPEALARYNQEVAAVGELSPASYKELSDLGIPKEMVDTYIAGQRAIGSGVIAEALEIVGGQDQYNAMRQWAAENVSKEDARVIDAAFNSGDKSQILWAVKGLTAQWRAATSQEPELEIQGVPQNISGIAPFRSQEEMTAAIRSPMYRRDPGYREMVEKRVSVSDFNSRR